MTIHIHPKPLTAAAFEPFGDVIETQGSDFKSINFGRTERYDDLAKLDTLSQEGHTGVSIFRSRPLPGGLPFTVKVMERHPIASQAFISMERKPFLVLVAPPTNTTKNKPNSSELQLFLVGANQGVNFHRGVWHHYSFSLGENDDETTDFLCIDRCGGHGNNCDEYYFGKKGDSKGGTKRGSDGASKTEAEDDSESDEEVIIYAT